jgi:tRNA threonylcarbamoyladenosine biosynthesis protein TsaE
LKLMEWPDKVAGQLPPPDWVIALEAIDEDQRRVRISAHTPAGQLWLKAWLHTDASLKPPATGAVDAP